MDAVHFGGSSGVWGIDASFQKSRKMQESSRKMQNSQAEYYFCERKMREKNDDPATEMRFLAYGRRKSPLHRGFLDAGAEPHLPTISFASHQPIPEVEIRFEDLPKYPTLHDDLRICTVESYTYRRRVHVLARGIFSPSFGPFLVRLVLARGVFPSLKYTLGGGFSAKNLLFLK